jgi:protein-S-isoprenylcysteine O-methyltransferase Ste14
VRFPPPILFVLGLGVGSALDTVAPLPMTPESLAPVRVVLGWAALVAGAGLLVWAMLTFARARTAIFPNRPARAVVAEGPYRFSRNPMYVALSGVVIGAGFVANKLWIVAVLPAVLVVLVALVIRREEHYLAVAFGEQYTSYQERVRRWL